MYEGSLENTLTVSLNKKCLLQEYLNVFMYCNICNPSMQNVNKCSSRTDFFHIFSISAVHCYAKKVLFFFLMSFLFFFLIIFFLQFVFIGVSNLFTLCFLIFVISIKLQYWDNYWMKIFAIFLEFRLRKRQIFKKLFQV